MSCNYIGCNEVSSDQIKCPYCNINNVYICNSSKCGKITDKICCGDEKCIKSMREDRYERCNLCYSSYYHYSKHVVDRCFCKKNEFIHCGNHDDTIYCDEDECKGEKQRNKIINDKLMYISDLKKRTYFNIKFADKDRAKQLKAKWDPVFKKWYGGDEIISQSLLENGFKLDGKLPEEYILKRADEKYN